MLENYDTLPLEITTMAAIAAVVCIKHIAGSTLNVTDLHLFRVQEVKKTTTV